MTLSSRNQTRALLISAASLLLVGIVVLRVLRVGHDPGSGEGKNGRMVRPTTGAASTGQFEASRAEPSEAVASGRFEHAFVLFRILGETQWNADICLALGGVLQKRDRLGLAWAALEAARRCDPKSSEAVRALDEMQAKLTTARGQERIKLANAADQLGFLTAIRGGPSLGLLIAGIARYASTPAQDAEFLDRLEARDRAVLYRVNSTVTATALLARVLMETGRASEAYDLLEPWVLKGRVTPSDLSGGEPTPEREAAWLLSRAALQLDRHETSDKMLARAKGFGKDGSRSPEPAPFVGSKRCALCHGEIFSQQQGASRHAQTLHFGADLKNVPLPERPLPDPVTPGITHRFSRTQNGHIEVESRTGDQVFQAVVTYAVGSGRHGITMLATDRQGVVRELRVSYFAETKSWGETKGINFAPRDGGEHIGLGLSSGALHRCLQCHTTWFRSVDDEPSVRGEPVGQDRGIGCERCHGPGLNHVKAVQSGYHELAIALTSKTPSSVRLKSCAECHSADGSIQPTDPEFTRAQGTTFLFSRCYLASKDKFGCTTCHDPHRSVETSVAHYEAKCLGCHGGTMPGLDGSQASRVGHNAQPAIAPSCPVNATARCVSCHMPKVADPSRRARFTDHHIRVHRTAAAGAASQ